MGASSTCPCHHFSSSSILTKRAIAFVLYALVPLALLHYLLSLPPRLPSPPTTGAATSPSRPQQAEEAPAARCDYSDGEWVRTAAGPRYNGSSCGKTIKAGQNCEAHGRPDTGYIYWRWRPRGCALPPFDPEEFLSAVRGRHVAFVGDSLARNQCESLVCLLASAFPAQLVRGAGGGDGDGDGDELRKFRRWAFPSHNATVSVFWSPFLVNGTERPKSPAAAGGLDHNRIYFDQPDERWAAAVPGFDVVVLSAGQWYLNSAMFYDRGAVIGCHRCPEPNRTETGFFGVFRLAVRNALREVISRVAATSSPARPRLAVVTTFSPAHFQGDWDSPTACVRTQPYARGEREMEYMDLEMLRAGVEEVAAAGADASERGAGLAVEALQVTRLAAMRPDGHPGLYTRAFPFAEGAKDRMPNDCVHWCLPGPIDTWNEILLQLVKGWAVGVGAIADTSSPSP
ncbi:Protein ALTERED XYLOGLUCAN 4 [Zea mays]|uniref:Protein ALTERED XYLOGLUCAN 4 n=1 Tax=Zea mays TaxID=4577 RepID=A0A3L6FW64_MAIZE|nr:Protein ALTERED XYLOGLUCAN 4 [Zea mays]